MEEVIIICIQWNFHLRNTISLKMINYGKPNEYYTKLTDILTADCRWSQTMEHVLKSCCLTSPYTVTNKKLTFNNTLHIYFMIQWISPQNKLNQRSSFEHLHWFQLRRIYKITINEVACELVASKIKRARHSSQWIGWHIPSEPISTQISAQPISRYINSWSRVRIFIVRVNTLYTRCTASIFASHLSVTIWVLDIYLSKTKEIKQYILSWYLNEQIGSEKHGDSFLQPNLLH